MSTADNESPQQKAVAAVRRHDRSNAANGRGNQSAPQKFVHWWDAAIPRPGPNHGSARALPSKALKQATPSLRYWMNSPHFWTAVSPAPQGMIGTEEVEFFGEPSISLSE